MKDSLTDADYQSAAARLGVEEAVIRAVAEVESGPFGAFLPTDEPVILFERHIFSRLTKGRFNSTHPAISNPVAGGYGRVSRQHARLQKAVALDRNAALQSASWGRFQVLGINWQSLGYPSLQQFVNAMYRSERDHLETFLRFVEVNNLVSALRSKNWTFFARAYNGPKYSVNAYDLKLRNAYEKLKAQEIGSPQGKLR